MGKLTRRVEKCFCDLCQRERSHVVQTVMVESELTKLPVISVSRKCISCGAISQESKLAKVTK